MPAEVVNFFFFSFGKLQLQSLILKTVLAMGVNFLLQPASFSNLFKSPSFPFNNQFHRLRFLSTLNRLFELRYTVLQLVGSAQKITENVDHPVPKGALHQVPKKID